MGKILFLGEVLDKQLVVCSIAKHCMAIAGVLDHAVWRLHDAYMELDKRQRSAKGKKPVSADIMRKVRFHCNRIQSECEAVFARFNRMDKDAQWKDAYTDIRYNMWLACKEEYAALEEHQREAFSYFGDFTPFICAISQLNAVIAIYHRFFGDMADELRKGCDGGTDEVHFLRSILSFERVEYHSDGLWSLFLREPSEEEQVQELTAAVLEQENHPILRLYKRMADAELRNRVILKSMKDNGGNEVDENKKGETKMNYDYAYCEGKKPFRKCKNCKRYIENMPKRLCIWMLEECHYEPSEKQ